MSEWRRRAAKANEWVEKEEHMEQQELKKRVLALLQRNARMALREMAERLDCTEEAVATAIRELEEEHIIVGYAAVVSEEARADEVRAIIEIEVQPERDTGYDTLAERLAKFPEVRSLYLVSGRYDFQLEIIGHSLQEIASFVAGKLACQPGVKSTATYFMLKKYKESGIQLSKGEKYERLKIVP